MLREPGLQQDRVEGPCPTILPCLSRLSMPAPQEPYTTDPDSWGLGIQAPQEPWASTSSQMGNTYWVEVSTQHGPPQSTGDTQAVRLSGEPTPIFYMFCYCMPKQGLKPNRHLQSDESVACHAIWNKFQSLSQAQPCFVTNLGQLLCSGSEKII